MLRRFFRSVTRSSFPTECQIVDFAAKNRLSAMYHRMEFVDTGGLMAYGPSYNDLFLRAATYVDKNLKRCQAPQISPSNSRRSSSSSAI